MTAVQRDIQSEWAFKEKEKAGGYRQLKGFIAKPAAVQ